MFHVIQKGRNVVVKTVATKVAAEKWISEQTKEVFKPWDYYITEEGK